MLRYLLDRSKHILISLKVSILTVFITLFLITTIAIILIRSIAYEDEVTFVASSLMNHVSTAVLREVRIGMQPVEIQGRFSANLLQSGVLQDKQDQLVTYTFYLVNTMPLVQRAFWVDDVGNYISAEKENDGTISTNIFNRHIYDQTHQPTARTIIYRDLHGNQIKSIPSPDTSYDATAVFWYKQAQQEKHFFWTDIHLFHLLDHLGITAISPALYPDGRFRGLFGLNISLDYLKEFITHQYISPHGFSFVITKNGDLLAFPNMWPFSQLHPKPNQLINVNQLKLPLIRESLGSFNQTGKTEFTLTYNHNVYLVSYHAVPELSKYGWLIGVIIEKNDLVSFLQKVNLLTLIACFLILVVGITIVSGLVTRIVRPINLLVDETQKIKNFELESKINIRTRIKEVFYLTQAIDSMRRGLKQFQKYVPKILVRQLIETGEDVRLGGTRRQLAVLFSDVQDFTAIAENMDPNQLMRQVCEYFELLSQIIIQEKGTVDKYIGDSVMAFWGAPAAETFSCEAAARAALHCQEKITLLNQQWQDRGLPMFITRMGLHVGEAIVGNMGSSERISYTALGDAINTTSRLENINKVYHTHILVSENMYEAIKDQFILRLIDRVMIRGRTHSMCLYELLAENKTDVPFDIDNYRTVFAKGFEAYEKKQWQVAIEFFKECLVIFPEDTVAPVFIERCQQ